MRGRRDNGWVCSVGEGRCSWSGSWIVGCGTLLFEQRESLLDSVKSINEIIKEPFIHVDSPYLETLHAKIAVQVSVYKTIGRLKTMFWLL